MKFAFRIFPILFILLLTNRPLAKAQQHETQQLLLNVEKLTQLKRILQNMYDGYEILDKGYTAIKDISQGNFSIHQTFLDGLLAVSPTVRKYKRVADIISYQIKIVSDCKSAYKTLKESRRFSPQEIDYIAKVYANLSDHSLKNLDELTTVLTARKLRMSDQERIEAIDRIFSNIQEQWSFLSHFNNTAKLLSLSKAKERKDTDAFKDLLDIK